VATADASPVEVAQIAAAAAAGVPGVVGFHSGTVGEIATYGGGRRIEGIRLRPGSPPSIAAYLVVAYGQSLHDLAAAVRQAVAGALAEHAGPGFALVAVDVHIADLRAAGTQGAGP
jgi:uncharacterized alkaline shock family protein YloU